MSCMPGGIPQGSRHNAAFGMSFEHEHVLERKFSGTVRFTVV